MIRLLIADDHPVVREGVRRIVESYPDMKVVGESVDGDDALAKIAAIDVDVLLLDVAMPGPGFLRVMERIRNGRARPKVLVLSVHPEDQYALRALRAGAAGYLTKCHEAAELVGAIRRIYRGGRYISPTLAERLAFELDPDEERLPHEALSDREYQVLCLMGSGHSMKEIGAQLDLSPKTVSTYRTRILSKMKLATTADLIRYVVEQGLES